MKYLYRAQLINILIAMLIGLFVIFPDMVRLLDEKLPSATYAVDNPMPQRYEGPPREFNPRFQQHEGALPPRMDRPPQPERKTKSLFFDFLFFFLLSWGLLLINNPAPDKRKRILMKFSSRTRPLVIIGLTFIICYLGIYLYSFFQPDSFFPHYPFPWYLNGILLFKGLFVFVSIVLFGQLFNLLYRQQTMNIEYERLKSESLQNRFEALTAQISPHFFFNSLNSLSGLIREKDHEKALKYINEISHLFRYILKGNWQELVSLKEEILFLKAYRYLLDIKYEDKLSFRIHVPEELETRRLLPALSLQPLIENIIKHNIISDDSPMTISVYLKDDGILRVENDYQPKADIRNSTGIGLSNLEKRYKYLTGKELSNYIREGLFIVELPLTEAN